MKILILLISILTLCGCNTTSQNDNQIYRKAISNFVYESDIEDERRIYENIDDKFYGDCEDFAFTLQKQIGGEVWYVILNDKTSYRYHAVLMKDGLTYDYIYKSSWKENYPARFMFVMKK